MDKKGADFKVIVSMVLGALVLLALIVAFTNAFNPFNNEVSTCQGQCVPEDTGCSFPAVQRTGSPCKEPGKDPVDGEVCCISPGDLTSDSDESDSDGSGSSETDESDNDDSTQDSN